MSATTSLPRPIAALLGLVGILSTGCASMVQVGPRPPGGETTTASPVVVDDSPFSIEERARIVAVDPWIELAASKHRIDPDLLRGLVWVESRFDPRAQSPAGARGLMQLMPATAAGLAPRVSGSGRPDAYDPQFNVAAGTLYLSDMLGRYHGDVVLALAAYNAGPGNVDRWLEDDGELPPRSREYADLVLAAKQRFEKRWHMPAERTSTQLAAAPKPARAPAPVVIPEPPAAEEPDPPLRWDLDKVERSDAPSLVHDEPERDVPVPAFTRDDDHARAPATTDDEPAIGLGVLPSVGE